MWIFFIFDFSVSIAPSYVRVAAEKNKQTNEKLLLNASVFKQYESFWREISGFSAG